MRKTVLFLLCLAVLPLAAQTSDFDRVVSAILDSNPTLAAGRLTASAERLEQESENVVEAPSVDFTHVWGTAGIGNKMQVDVSQEFEWPGVYGARSRAARASESAALMGADAARLDLAGDIRGQLMELVYVRRQLKVLSDLRNSFATLSDAIDKGVKGGELTALDQRKMQIETYEIDNQIAAVQVRERQIEASLQGLSRTRLDLSGITAYPAQQQLSLSEYLENAATDPAVLAQRLAADSESAKARAAKMSHLPGFSVGYEYQREMGDQFNGVTFGLKLPVIGGSKAKAAAESRRLAAEQEAENALASRRAAIESAYAQLEKDRSRLEAYNRTFGDSQYPALLLKAYQGGQMSVIEYLSEIHYYHQNMLTYLETEYSYNAALAALNRRQVS